MLAHCVVVAWHTGHVYVWLCVCGSMAALQLISCDLATSFQSSRPCFLISLIAGVPKSRRGEIWQFLALQYRLRHRLPNKQQPPDISYKELLKQLTAQQHAILVESKQQVLLLSFFFFFNLVFGVDKDDLLVCRVADFVLSCGHISLMSG